MAKDSCLGCWHLLFTFRRVRNGVSEYDYASCDKKRFKRFRHEGKPLDFRCPLFRGAVVG